MWVGAGKEMNKKPHGEVEGWLVNERKNEK